METTTAPRTRTGARTPATTLALTCTGYFMVILDATVTNVALRSIGRGLHGGVTGVRHGADHARGHVGGDGVGPAGPGRDRLRCHQRRPAGRRGARRGGAWLTGIGFVRFAGGMRIGLVIAACAFLAGAALVSGLAREPG